MADREKLHMVLDDTVNIGKEPFVPQKKEYEDFLRWAMSIKDDYKKK